MLMPGLRKALQPHQVHLDIRAAHAIVSRVSTGVFASHCQSGFQVLQHASIAGNKHEAKQTTYTCA